MKEDKFQYQISDGCISCEKCKIVCPANAITVGLVHMEINKEKCIDCGTCSIVCPTGAASAGNTIRESLILNNIEKDKLYLNAGCAISEYKPYLPPLMYELLKQYYPTIQMHNTCCRHNPGLPEGSTIIANCGGCDRRFRSLYNGVNTVSFWEILDSLENPNLPDYRGMSVTVHDSCGYRHKPQVHKAIRSLLYKMNIEVIEAEYHGTISVCCGDNFYGLVSNDNVEKRIKVRADQMPCENVVVYCIGCVRAMQSGGKKPFHLLDLIFQRKSEPMLDTLDEYHNRLNRYIEEH